MTRLSVNPCWNRARGTISVYLDVRGEHDLRPAEASVLQWHTPNDDNSLLRPTRLGFSVHRQNRQRAHQWHSTLAQRVRGHVKGCLEFLDAGNIFQPGRIISFQYAANIMDYAPVPLVTLGPNETVEDLFRVGRHYRSATDDRNNDALSRSQLNAE